MEFIALSLITLVAAIVQAATGFGFGVVAVTFFLIVIKSAHVVQMVIMITLMITLLHFRKVRCDLPVSLFKHIMPGCCLGYPVGLFLFYHMNIHTLKLGVALLILWMSAQNLWDRIKAPAPSLRASQDRPIYSGFIGVLSGIMAITLAMPGPVIVSYLTRLSMTKEQIRAMVIISSTCSYCIAITLQAASVGISAETLKTVLSLLPAALIGAFLGDWLTRFIPNAWFKNITLCVLLISGINLLLSL